MLLHLQGGPPLTHFAFALKGGGRWFVLSDQTTTSCSRLWLKTCHRQLFLTRRPTHSNQVKQVQPVFFIYTISPPYYKTSFCQMLSHLQGGPPLTHFAFALKGGGRWFVLSKKTHKLFHVILKKLKGLRRELLQLVATSVTGATFLFFSLAPLI